jgi:tRNA (guanine-N7-)-methyltransferase
MSDKLTAAGPRSEGEQSVAPDVQLVPKSYFKRLTIEELFSRAAPLEIDVGCGEGGFLLEMACRYPERNFLGIERLAGRVQNVCRRVAHQGIQNVRILRIENQYAVEHLLPFGSVAVAHVLFPDPWPKRYHQPRRLFQDAFLRALHAALQPHGELRVKTDDLPYFEWMLKTFERAKAQFERLPWPDDPEAPRTNFERGFLAKGLPVYRARLRRI